MKVAADSGRFDYAYVVSSTHLYNGRQGILLLAERDGNIWFLGETQPT